MTQLTDHQIHSIEDKIKEGLSNSQIGRIIVKDRSVIIRLFREYPRDTFIADAVIADRFRKKSQATQGHIRIEPGGMLALYIHEKFFLDWSPQQIAERWKKREKSQGSETQETETQGTETQGTETQGTETQGTETQGTETQRTSIRLSKDTVYDWIYSSYDPKELTKHLRRKNKEYRDRKKEAALGGKYQMGDQIRIDERAKKYPDTMKRDEEGKRLEEVGHWEGDTIIGKNRSGAILTLVERRTGQTIIGELPLGKNAVGLTSALTKVMAHIPKGKLKSITFDNGREFADHKMMQYELGAIDGIGVDIYFAYPYHSWERGTNENTNGLIRQYIPKKTDFSKITQKDLDKIQILLNSRPRKRLNYSTPDQMFWGNEKCGVSE